MVADRFFAAQRIMGILHFLAAYSFFLATRVTGSTLFYWVICSILLYMPTIALSNSIRLDRWTDPEGNSPGSGVFGTTG